MHSAYRLRCSVMQSEDHFTFDIKESVPIFTDIKIKGVGGDGRGYREDK